MNRFDELLKAIESGELSLTHIQIAYRASLRRMECLEGVSDILAGKGDVDAGILFGMFQSIGKIGGGLELAYRRGYQAGMEAHAKEAVK